MSIYKVLLKTNFIELSQFSNVFVMQLVVDAINKFILISVNLFHLSKGNKIMDIYLNMKRISM